MWDLNECGVNDMGKLTALKVKNAKPGKHGDGDGLFLVVSDTDDPQMGAAYSG
ncbi:MAG: hypothetical protein ACI8S3_002532 [Alphaproteobacteria bacterium]|jgi:hypothetical protein